MHEDADFWTEFTELLRSGPHWAFEIVSDIVVGAVGAALGWGFAKTRFNAWLKKHDSEVHGA